MHAQHYYWWAGGTAMVVAVIAGIADYRRLNRKRIDDIGWVPWRGIQVFCLFAAVAFLLLGTKLS